MSVRILPAISLLLALIFAGAVPAAAESRVALVIGNGAYRAVPTLPNPAVDAEDVAAALERLGFSTRRLTDATYEGMRRELIEFGRRARGADMAIIYYAGHGMEVGGENWLLPVDAQLRNDSDIDKEAIGLKAAMLAVSGTKELGLVIMDACRNNPFAASMQLTDRRRAVTRGLAAVAPTDNVLVAYAAKDGTTAQDGNGRNSPFTAALLRHIETPGLEISFLFRNVRDDVLEATQREQQPFVYGSLSSRAIYLKLPQSADEAMWSLVAKTNDIAVLQRFIDQFPASTHVAEAKSRIASLSAATVTPAPQATRTATDPKNAVTGCPKGDPRCRAASGASATPKCLPGVWYRPGTSCGDRRAANVRRPVTASGASPSTQ